MQPYFFPYIEYFRLIAESDLWIAFDTVKYNKKSWMSRNRILNKDKDWSYINVPIVKQDATTVIGETRIDISGDWQKKFFDKLRVYEKEAPNYTNTILLLRDMLDQGHTSLGGLNFDIIMRLCRIFEIDADIVRLSELSLDLPDRCAPGEWALFICKAVGANKYTNAIGGRELFDPRLYEHADVELSFHKHINFKYDTGSFNFTADLSIIDVLMWVDWETVKATIHQKP